MFLVFVDDNDGRIVVGNILGYYGRGVCGVLHGAEKLFNLGFNVVYVHVAHNDDALVCGVIPFFIVVAQLLILKVVYHAHQSDGVAQAVFRAGIELRQVAFEHSAAGTCAQTPLFVYHSALLVNLFGVECKATSPVAKDKQARV